MFGHNQERTDVRIGIEAADGLWSLICLKDGDSDKYIANAQSIPMDESVFESELQQWVQKNQLEKAPCYVVLPEGSYQLHLLEKPAVEEKEISQAIGWLMKDHLRKNEINKKVDTEEYAIEYFPLPPGMGLQDKPMVFVVAIEKSILRKIIDPLDKAGLSIKKIDIAELAMRSILSAHSDTARGIAYLSLCKGAGNLHFYRENRLCFSRSFEVLFDLDGQVEVDRLSLEIQRSMDYYERQMRQVNPLTLFCCGEDLTIPVIEKLKILTGLKILSANLTEWVEGEIAEEDLRSPAYTAALSVAMQSRQPVENKGNGTLQ